MVNALACVRLTPLTLVDCIILQVCWVAYVEFKQGPTIPCAQRVDGNQVIEGNPGKMPLVSIIGTDTVIDKEQLVHALDDDSCN